MPQKVGLIDDLNLIELHTYGETTEEDIMTSRKTIGQLCEQHKVTGLLLDGHKATSFPDYSSLLEFGTSLCELVLPLRVRIALVASDQIKSESDFLETVCRNREILLQVFDSRDNAVKWLTS